jgi:indole-3-glycerol phosphate synthase
MKNILEQILETKRNEVAQRSIHSPLQLLIERARKMPATRGFEATLRKKATHGAPAVIAEIKKASPSKGLIRENFDPQEIAISYACGGADCLSVLTDQQYFQGHDDYLSIVRNACNLPVLRKDFIVDEYQIYEARALSADCVLLIAAALNIMELTVFVDTARNLKLDVLIEVHNPQELEAALSLNPSMVGINNRDLKSFTTSIDNTIQLIKKIPDHILVVTESGISERAQVLELQSAGVGAFLVGESFMRAENPGQALTELFRS